MIERKKATDSRDCVWVLGRRAGEASALGDLINW